MNGERNQESITRGIHSKSVRAVAGEVMYSSHDNQYRSKMGIFVHNNPSHTSTDASSLLAINNLLAPDANHLHHLLPEAARRLAGEQVFLVPVEKGPVPDEVDVLGADPLCALQDLPEDEQARGHDLHGVVGEEGADVESRAERGPAVGEDDDGLQDEGDPGAVGLEVAVVGHGAAVDILRLARGVVVEEGYRHHDVVDNAAARDEGQQPFQDLGGAATALEEGQHGEDHGDGEAVDGDAVLGSFPEDGRGPAVAGEGVEGPGRAVCVRVSGGEDCREEQGIHQVGQALDLEVLHGHDPGGGGGGSAAAPAAEVDLLEDRVVVGQHDSTCQSSAEEEEAESHVDGLEGRLDVPAGVLRLGSDHRDVVRADNGEGGSGQSSHEAFHTARVTGSQIRRKGSGIGKVPEAVGIVGRVASDHSDECEQEQDEDEYHLSARQPEFCFTKHAHSSHIHDTRSHTRIV